MLLLALAGCQPLDLTDDPWAYIENVDYRRGILERDLTYAGNTYGEKRLLAYARPEWEDLPERDPMSGPLYVLDGTGDRRLTEARVLLDSTPSTDEDWIALGREVFFTYPLRAEPVWTALADAPGALAEVGTLEHEGRFVGLRVIEDDGEPVVARTCASCHASFLDGEPSGVLSNRAMDVGRASLLAGVLDPVLELNSTAQDQLAALGPGRSDVLPDTFHNPYAFPDFGGIADQPRLHHNGNWSHTGIATLAVRCETLFITTTGERFRPPRELTWALAAYLHSLPAPPPVNPPDERSEAGERVFEDAGCAGCHTPPLFTSDQVVPVEVIGTDPLAATAPPRRSPGYRVPSLRGVGRTAPYLHDGVLPDLETMFDPAREVPGHPFGLELGPTDREALLAYLRTL